MTDRRALSLNGRTVHYYQEGRGEPLLYLHGIGGDSLWLPFHRALSREFAVTVPLHPGFGDSDDEPPAGDMEEIAFHYHDFAESLSLGRVHLVGASFGGWIAAELAVRHPGLVRTLTLIAAAGLHLPEAPAADLFAATDPRELASLLFHDPTHPIARSIAELDPRDPLSVGELLKRMRAMTAVARIGWNPYLHNPKLPRLLSRITAPTLIVWGEEDRLIPPAHGDAYSRLIPVARMKRVPRCGHLPPIERPSETAQVVLDFLLTQKSLAPR